LEAQGKYITDPDGLIVTYSNFKTNYPLYIFDVSKTEPEIFEGRSAVDIYIDYNFLSNVANNYFSASPQFTAATPTTANVATNTYNTAPYLIWCILETERHGILNITKQAMTITL
jgi:hypothetical protein